MNDRDIPNTLLTLEECARLACCWEATARKPGNVHPEASFDDLCYNDFITSADLVAPILANAQQSGVGQTVYEAVRLTQQSVGKNTNLGIVLLLAPLAAVPREIPLQTGIADVLDSLTRHDAELVYRAIPLAHPGGMGQVEDQNLASTPTDTLLEVMKLAADRDAIALQYASQFDLVLNVGLPLLERFFKSDYSAEDAVIGLHLNLMTRVPDTLIARKCGSDVAQQSANFAADVLEAGWPTTTAGREKLVTFDRWLRGDRHRRNPGTTADLVAACLFAGLREQRLTPPQADEVRTFHTKWIGNR